MLISFIATVAGAALDFANTTGITFFTLSFEWARLLWIIAGATACAAVPFVAFHRMRLRYDSLVQQNAPIRRLAECKRAMREHADKGNSLLQQGASSGEHVGNWGVECRNLLQKYLGMPEANQFAYTMKERLSSPSGNEVPIEIHVLRGEIHWLFSRADEIKEADVMR